LGAEGETEKAQRLLRERERRERAECEEWVIDWQKKQTGGHCLTFLSASHYSRVLQYEHRADEATGSGVGDLAGGPDPPGDRVGGRQVNPRAGRPVTEFTATSLGH
jgi:hypothetical protein